MKLCFCRQKNASGAFAPTCRKSWKLPALLSLPLDRDVERRNYECTDRLTCAGKSARSSRSSGISERVFRPQASGSYTANTQGLQRRHGMCEFIMSELSSQNS